MVENSFASRWIKKLNGVISNMGNATHKHYAVEHKSFVELFHKEYGEAIIAAAKFAIQAERKTADPLTDEEIQEVMQHHMEETGQGPHGEGGRNRNNMRARISYLNRFTMSCMDEYTQLARADTLERRRYLGYRMATGIGLAAILLGTYWLGNFWEIPMPLRGVPLPQ
ncbi:hypothetical protein EYC87_05365 [Halieaceae bacterium IMCC8485]|uniref:Uncharacterized protein n=1 Tax=Candidatus Seongchinamella marina TaxID=2518990 RepID=A0ABT3SSP8_9GAMM|nr:hypothetical protein [Candidatus Seongchinamella marina]MCX2973013.1 hypothetical protein [Candidatus Seongchinamella marina]